MAKLKLPLIWVLAISAMLFVFSGCASGKGASAKSSSPVQSSELLSEEPSTTNDEGVEAAKQSAEQAEWEAHRLREELNRKNANK